MWHYRSVLSIPVGQETVPLVSVNFSDLIQPLLKPPNFLSNKIKNAHQKEIPAASRTLILDSRYKIETKRKAIDRKKYCVYD